MDPIYLVVSQESRPLGLNITLQLKDDPILQPAITNIRLEDKHIVFSYNTFPEYNPQIDELVAEVQEDRNPLPPRSFLPGEGEGRISVREGCLYSLRIFSRTQLVPTPRTSPAVGADVPSDFIVTIEECRDSYGQVLEGALVIVFPITPFYNVSPSETGQPWPELPYVRCNRTDSSGKCQIRIPPGHGEAVVVMIPAQHDKGGDIIAHVVVVEPREGE